MVRWALLVSQPRPTTSGLDGARRSRLISRGRLLELLDHAPSIVVISAPAGSGKTELLKAWAGERERVAWVTVERDELDAERLFTDVRNALAAATNDQSLIDEVADPRVLGERLSVLDEGVDLIIDDLHEIRDASVLGGLRSWLGTLGPQTRVLLAARHDPDVGLHALRLTGQVREIRDADLRFTEEEAAALLRAAGVRLSARSLRLLHQRTEGWAAGLRLAALSLRQHPDPERFVGEFSGANQGVAEYLFAEVLDRQSPEVRRVLTRTAVVNRVNGPLADRLTGTSGNERTLERLTADSAFVRVVDENPRWFAYHQLFRDLLLLELRRSDPSAEAELHADAARWHAHNGDIVEAISHAQSAGDWTFAARMLSEHHQSLSLDGRSSAAKQLFDRFPADRDDVKADLAVVGALNDLLENSPEGAAEYAQLAEQLLPGLPEERRAEFEIRLRVIRLSLARRKGDFDVVLAMGKSFDRVPRSAVQLRTSREARAIALKHLGATEMFCGRNAAAEGHLLDGLEITRQINRPFLEVGCLGYLALARQEEAPDDARRLAERAVSISTSKHWSEQPVVGPALLALARLAAAGARFSSADAWLAAARSCINDGADPMTGVLLHLECARTAAAVGDDARALTELGMVSRLRARLAVPLRTDAEAESILLEAALLTRTGCDADAEALLEAQSSSAPKSALLAVGRARRLVQNERPEEALEAVSSRLRASVDVRLQAMLLTARAADQLGDAGRTRVSLEAALDLAEPAGIVFPFLFDDASALLSRHPAHQTTHAAFVAQLLRGAQPDRMTAGSRDIELSASERRVLGFLPGHLTAHGIASELHLSSNTVKTHMRHLYAKLGAHTRAEAVQRGRAANLLSPASPN